jgi:hypothetical protein
MFQYRLLGRKLGPIREEVTGGCRKLRNKKLPTLYFLPNVSPIRIIKLRHMHLEGHVALMGSREMDIKFWSKTRREKTTWNNWAYMK